ncbi:MAG: glycoside hydrolase family 26 protein [Phycisphaerae bacterium]
MLQEGAYNRACGLAALSVLVALMIHAGRPEPERPTRSEPPEWGLYQILWSRSYEQHLRREIAHFASKPDYIMFYRDLGRPFPKAAVDAVRAVGATPMVSLELWTWHGDRKGSHLPAIVRGEYDDFLRNWARDARTDGRRVLLRFGFEFNGDWFTWSLDPKAYVAAWRHARDIFRRERAGNVEWVWSPNIVSVPDNAKNNMHRYYPGDAEVDWLSLDGYNFGEHHDRWHHWQSFEDVFGAALRDFEKRHPHKPIILSEFGCAPGKGDQRARWIRDAYACLKRYPQVKAVIWFNYDKRRENEPNWRIDASPGALRAFNETFAAPRSSEPGARRTD